MTPHGTKITTYSGQKLHPRDLEFWLPFLSKPKKFLLPQLQTTRTAGAFHTTYTPQAVRISEAAPELECSLCWGKTLLYLTESLAVLVSSVITHCPPESTLQLRGAARYPDIPGA